jgi:hypothetical protein
MEREETDAILFYFASFERGWLFLCAVMASTALSRGKRKARDAGRAGIVIGRNCEQRKTRRRRAERSFITWSDSCEG